MTRSAAGEAHEDKKRGQKRIAAGNGLAWAPAARGRLRFFWLFDVEELDGRQPP